MPNENDEVKQGTPEAALDQLKRDVEAVAGPDPRIAELEKQLAELQARYDAQAKKLSAAKSAPTGDVVVLDGVSHAVLGTYRADNTFADVKRGYVDEGTTLVNIAKQH